MTPMRFDLNWRQAQIDVPDGMSLLWVPPNMRALTGTGYRFGPTVCGARIVHVAGKATRTLLLLHRADRLRGRIYDRWAHDRFCASRAAGTGHRVGAPDSAIATAGKP